MAQPLDQFALWTGLFGGFALFLFGMDIMATALKRAAGSYLKDLLGRLTRNRFLGVCIGAFVTAVVNSSSATTVILVGFIAAGLLSMAQGVSIIMGANIGSTFTAQILAFKVTTFALPMLTVGFLLSFLPSRGSTQDYGRILLGAGLVFYGMGLMSDAMVPLRSYPPFLDFITTLAHPIAAAAVGAVFTAVIQSSAATTGIVLVLAGQGLLSLEAAIAIALGANIGTCATAGLAVLGKPREAVRAAVVHVLFNVAGVILWIAFVPQLADVVRWLSPTAGHLDGLARSAAEAPRQVANAHTLFNVVNTLLFIGFTPQIARLVEWLVPDAPLSKEEMLEPKYLDDALLSTPAVALESARLEAARLGTHVLSMVKSAMPAAVSDSRRDLEALSAMDKAADRLHRAILAYLGRISIGSLSEDEARQLMQVIEVANDLEHIGDRIATDIVTSARKRIDEHASMSQPAIIAITALHERVARALGDALTAVRTKDEQLASAVRQMKHEVSATARSIERASVSQLAADPAHHLMSYVREIELLEILDGVFKIARRIARSQLQLSAVSST